GRRVTRVAWGPGTGGMRPSVDWTSGIARGRQVLPAGDGLARWSLRHLSRESPAKAGAHAKRRATRLDPRFCGGFNQGASEPRLNAPYPAIAAIRRLTSADASMCGMWPAVSITCTLTLPGRPCAWAAGMIRSLL